MKHISTFLYFIICCKCSTVVHLNFSLFSFSCYKHRPSYTRVPERFPSGFRRLFPSQLVSISFLVLHSPLTRVVPSRSTGLPDSSQQLPGDLLSSISAVHVWIGLFVLLLRASRYVEQDLKVPFNHCVFQFTSTVDTVYTSFYRTVAAEASQH